MYQPAWSEIEAIYQLPHVSKETIAQFKLLKSTQTTHTKGEGNQDHYCSFFLPYDRLLNRIYLCHHIKADDFIPPGGHLEPGETPLQAAIREMQEELNYTVSPASLEPWNLSVKYVNRPEFGCTAHYDVWHLVHLDEQEFKYDPREYYQAHWFDLTDGLNHIKKNPDFAAIISQLSQA